MRMIGRLIGLFSFDVGWEIDLALARTLVPPLETEEGGRKKPAPPYFTYASPPLRTPLGRHTITLDGVPAEVHASARIHDFGAVTLLMEIPWADDLLRLPELTATLTSGHPLSDLARRLLGELFDKLRPAIAKAGLNDFIEDYFVVQVDRLDPPVAVGEFMQRERAVLAAALRCERGPLSTQETDEVFSDCLSYTPDDLVVAEWNVALVLDQDYLDALHVFEYLNVQLLELRYFDALLERRVAQFFPEASAASGTGILRLRAHRRVIDELSGIRLDVLAILERVHNALKLSGDLYVAKLHARTAQRLALPAWEQSVARKIEVLERVYETLVHRVTTARAELLEFTIVVLIVLELIVVLVR